MNDDFFATTNPKIQAPIGYGEVLAQFSELIENNNLPPVNLIHSPEGTGKRKFCEYIAGKILGNSSNQYSELNLHPDLLIIEQDQDTAKKEITIDRARSIKKFLQLTSSQSSAKVIIIDSIDKLNINAANSILKSLEEPTANSYFLLLCHNPDKILDTILSRTNKVKLPKLSKEHFSQILQNNNLFEEHEKLFELFPHQPGQAIKFIESNGLKLFNELDNILHNKSSFQEKTLLSKYEFKKELQVFNNTLPIMHYFIFRKIRDMRNNQQIVTSLNDYLLEFYTGFEQTIKLNLDRENFILNNLFKLKKIYG